MGNPGVYSSPTEGWAFVPFLGAVLAFAVVVLAILYWMAGPGLRIKAALFTTAALVISAGSVLGLFSAAASFEQRDNAAFGKHAIEVQAWAEREYDVMLTRDDVADLVDGRSVSVESRGVPVEVRLRPIPNGPGVYLVHLGGAPLQ
ncbi:hypothetical protein [Rhodoglobus aureus]|uniref:Uncharacterized protein n=1 Tax=Rhodoglobus aureus TaxID=191497 RepID=A0ABP4G587_9MICO